MADTLNTDVVTAALSRATARSARAAEVARLTFLTDTVAYAARLIRDALPTAAAITVDTTNRELHEIRDAQGETLWHAPTSGPTHRFNDSLVDDVDDLIREAVPFGGLAAAGWKTSAKGFPFRDVQLPEPPPATRHARAYVRHEDAVLDVHANLAPADQPSLTVRDRFGKTMREAGDRVRAAIINAGYDLPGGEVTVDLFGAGEPGSVADLAIACAILSAAGHVDRAALKRTVLLGELGLDGRVRVTDQTRDGVRFADLCGYKRVIVASTAATTCPLIPGGHVHGVLDLRQAIDRLAQPITD
ncbi:magnesium chelatase domain-containing protein [Streptomyces collinus]|uniref:magnesium chelatase domain-containing protein n=1 Tax=Streptomyces collinus TaxID=42684 RepID=UPI0036AF2BC3